LNVAVNADPRCPGRPERHALSGIARIGMHRVVGGDQLGDVNEVAGAGGLAGTRICHTVMLT